MTYRILHKSKEMMRVYFFFHLYIFGLFKARISSVIICYISLFCLFGNKFSKKGLVLGFKLTGDVRLC